MRAVMRALSGHYAGTKRALSRHCGHYTGTMRALSGHYAGAKRALSRHCRHYAGRRDEGRRGTQLPYLSHSSFSPICPPPLALSALSCLLPFHPLSLTPFSPSPPHSRFVLLPLLSHFFFLISLLRCTLLRSIAIGYMMLHNAF